jgi:hypothetical protein
MLGIIVASWKIGQNVERFGLSGEWVAEKERGEVGAGVLD